MSNYTQDVIELVTNNPRQFSYQDVADKFGGLNSEKVRGIARRNRAIFDLFKKKPGHRDNGIIEGNSSLIGEEPMQNPNSQESKLLKELCAQHNLPYDQWSMWWFKIPEHSICFRNQAQLEADNQMREEFLKQVTRAAPRIRKQPVPTKTLAVFASFDVHIGKHCELIRTGNEYTPEKAVRQVLEGQAALYEKTKPFGVSDILIPMGNDIVHVDNNMHTSTSGTPQDAYGSVESMIMLGADLYIKSIEELSKRHNVWLCHVHSNHDRVSGWSVSQIVAAYFRNNPRVHAATDMMSQHHRKYFVFGNSLIMFHHGEAKEERLLGVIKAEANQAMAQTNRIYCYQGHTHHTTKTKRGLNTQEVQKDHSGLTVIKAGNGAQNQLYVQTVRSPSPADQWHSQNLFSNIPAIEVFLLDENYQFANFVHEF